MSVAAALRAAIREIRARYGDADEGWNDVIYVLIRAQADALLDERPECDAA